MPSTSIPRGFKLFLLFLLPTLGMVISFYYIHHWQEAIYGFSAEKSFCTISQFLDCDSLQFTPTATLLGFPIGAWSLFYFISTLHLLALTVKTPTRISFWGLRTLTSLGALVALFKAVLALGVYHKLCLTCAIGWALLLAQWILTWIWIKPPTSFLPFKRPALTKHAVLSGLVLALSIIIVPNTMMISQAKKTMTYTKQMLEKIFQEGPREIPTGIINPNPPSGDYAKGNPEGSIQIIAFHDFECPVCDRQSQVFQRIFTRFHNDLHFVLKNFPLDHNCNPNINFLMHEKACYWAETARCIGKQNPMRFWTFYEVYHREDPKNSVDEISSALEGISIDAVKKCLQEDSEIPAIQTDITHGQALYVHATPTFYINGYRFEGYFPYFLLEQFILKLQHKGAP
jgi:protein-disulfide isomerase/uncharacterized membrane protein